MVPPAGDVITLVGVSWLAGLVALGTLTRAWPDVAPGHFQVVWLVSAGLGLAVGFLYRPAWAVAAASLTAFAAIYRRLDLHAGVLATVIAGAALGLLPGRLPGVAAAI